MHNHWELDSNLSFWMCKERACKFSARHVCAMIQLSFNLVRCYVLKTNWPLFGHYSVSKLTFALSKLLSRPIGSEQHVPLSIDRLAPSELEQPYIWREVSDSFFMQISLNQK